MKIPYVARMLAANSELKSYALKYNQGIASDD